MQILNSKQSFSIDEIAQFSQGYTYHQQTTEMLKVYDADFEWHRASELSMHSDFKQRTLVSTLFFKSLEYRSTSKPAATDIFSDRQGGA